MKDHDTLEGLSSSFQVKDADWMLIIGILFAFPV